MKVKELVRVANVGMEEAEKGLEGRASRRKKGEDRGYVVVGNLLREDSAKE